MKRLRACSLLVVLTLVAAILSACGSTASTSATGGASSNTTKSAARKTIRIGLVFKSLDSFYSVVKQYAQQTASKHPSVNLTVAAGLTGVDVDVQAQKVEDLLAKGINVLVITPDGPGIEPVLQRAVSQGVKVILLDNNLPNWSGKISYIGTDLPKGSTLAGQYLLSKLRAGAEVGIMPGILGLPAAVARYASTQQMLQKAGMKVFVASQADECGQAQAVSVAQDLLTAHPALSAIYAICGPEALGMDQVVNAYDRKTGRHIVRVGFDVVTGEPQNVLDGKQDAAIAQFADNEGTYGVEYAIKAAEGQRIPTRIDTGTALVTKANAKSFIPPRCEAGCQ